MIVALLDLIPLIGATIGAFIVAVVTLFTDFPTVTIIWLVFAIAYQQFENYVIQPRIQSRAVQLDPFVIVVAAIFGGTLLGVVGALLAIPVAAAGQIGVYEFRLYRKGEFDNMGADLEEGASLLPEPEVPPTSKTRRTPTYRTMRAIGAIPTGLRPTDVRQRSSNGGSVTT